MAVDRVTLRQKAYRRLRDKLSLGELRAGMQLSEPDLARELGMSRTPIREAIRQMEVEGLLDYAPRYGAIVRVPDAAELAEMYVVREALESCAAAEAAERVAPAELKRLGELCRKMRQIVARFRASGAGLLEGSLLERFLAIDLEFHQVVIRSSGNRYMTKLLLDAQLLVRVFTLTYWSYDKRRLSEAQRFHERLLKALQTGDGEAARRATVEAIGVARQNALRAMGKRLEIGD